MRVAVSHGKTKEEAVKIVNSTAEQVLRPELPGPVKMTDIQKNWQGDTLNFSLNASMGLMKTPIKGTIEVTDKDIIVEADLPSFLTKFIPESTIKTGIEGKVRGLLK